MCLAGLRHPLNLFCRVPFDDCVCVEVNSDVDSCVSCASCSSSVSGSMSASREVEMFCGVCAISKSQGGQSVDHAAFFKRLQER